MTEQNTNQTPTQSTPEVTPASINLSQAIPTPVATSAPNPEEMKGYVASSVEKKRAVMMYMLIGIIVTSLDTKQKSPFESFHLKQALGRWAVFMLVLIVSLLFLLIPIIKYLPIIILVIMLIFLGICIKQATDGKYGRDAKASLAIFAGLGERVLNLFETKPVK